MRCWFLLLTAYSRRPPTYIHTYILTYRHAYIHTHTRIYAVNGATPCVCACLLLSVCVSVNAHFDSPPVPHSSRFHIARSVDAYAFFANLTHLTHTHTDALTHTHSLTHTHTRPSPTCFLSACLLGPLPTWTGSNSLNPTHPHYRREDREGVRECGCMREGACFHRTHTGLHTATRSETRCQQPAANTDRTDHRHVSTFQVLSR